MTPIFNSNGKKACRVDPNRRIVEIANKNLKVTIEFLDNGSTSVICFTEEGAIADSYKLTPTI